MKRLISYERSIIVSADVSTAAQAMQLARAVSTVSHIGGFKLGLELGLSNLQRSVDAIRNASLPRKTVIIYDHQKAGNDIPDMGSKFARTVKAAGCDAAILFPFAGPETQARWTENCQDAGLRVIVGLVMTHAKFLVSEGGYIANDAPERAFRLACSQEVTDFVVPGTKLDWVTKLRSIVAEELGEGNYDLYAPGFITQGGDITECGLAAGPRFHAIVGSAIYGKSTYVAMYTAALAATQKLAE